MQTKFSNLEATIDARANCLARVSEAARTLAATHGQEQFRDATSRSCLGATILIDRVQLVPERDRWLGPIISPARSWQFRSKSTLAAVVCLVGIMAAAAMANIIPTGQFPSLDFWRQTRDDLEQSAVARPNGMAARCSQKSVSSLESARDAVLNESSRSDQSHSSDWPVALSSCSLRLTSWSSSGTSRSGCLIGYSCRMGRNNLRGVAPESNRASTRAAQMVDALLPSP